MRFLSVYWRLLFTYWYVAYVDIKLTNCDFRKNHSRTWKEI